MVTVLIGDRRVSVRSQKIEKIICWLVEQMEELDKAQKIKIEFNCANNNVRPARTIYDDDVT